MIPYILHVTVILTVCFLFYKLFLQKATFYGLNRWTLLSCLVLSFVLPILPAPRGWTWDPAAVDPVTVSDPLGAKAAASGNPATSAPSIEKMPQATATASISDRSPGVKPQHTTARKTHPATIKQPVTTATRDAAALPPATVAILPAAPPPPSHPFTTLILRGLQLLSYGYLIGLLVFGLKFILQILLLCYRSLSRPIIRDGRFRIVQTRGDRGPCTFANTIFINPALYDPETFRQILVHEKIHVSGGHTLDILLAELAVVFQWFNPFVWLYRREVENNLEFLTDRSVLEHPGIERLAYQLSLVRVSAPHMPFSITNNYNQSLLKRRIVMMNSKNSSTHTVWKYFFLLPLLTGLVCVLNKPAALGAASYGNGLTAVDGAASRWSATGNASPLSWLGLSAFWTEDRSAVADTSVHPASSGNATSKSDGAASGGGDSYRQEIALVPQIQVSPVVTHPDPSIAVNNVDVHVDLAPVSVSNIRVEDLRLEARGIGDSDLLDGSWFATSSNDKLSLELRAEREDHSWSSTLWVEKGEINPFPGQGTVEFKLVRDAGTMTFKGQFDGQEGFGHFHYTPNESYYTDLKQMGVDMDEDRSRMAFFSLNIKKDYVDMLMHNGYPHISERDLISFAAMKIDKDFIQYWRGSGYEDADEPRNLITLKAMKVDRAFVDELKAAGYDHIPIHQLTSLKAMHIDGAYIRSLGRGKDGEPIPLNELIRYKSMHIDSGYVTALRKLGYDDLPRNDVTSLYSLHVSPEYIKSLQDLGYKDIPVRDLIGLKARDITPEYIRSFKDIGYKDVDLREIGDFKAMHITPEYIKGFLDLGYKDIPWREMAGLKARDINPEYIKSFRDIGYKDLDIRQVNNFKAVGITPEFVKGFHDLGYDNLSAGELSSLKRLDITPDFVKEFSKIGFDHIPVGTLTTLKVSGVDADYVKKMKDKGFDSKDLMKYIRLKRDFN
jgi:hypothetical protein